MVAATALIGFGVGPACGWYACKRYNSKRNTSQSDFWEDMEEEAGANTSPANGAPRWMSILTGRRPLCQPMSQPMSV